MREARRKRGFERASKLVSEQIRAGSESRGFAVSRLLTHWDEIVGPDLASQARPVEVNYGRGFGATLTLLTSGAIAPMVEMQKEAILERVNACYGYAAIQRIRLTQTAPRGFAEPGAAFEPAPAPRQPDAAATQAARQSASVIANDDLRAALERLGANVLSQIKQK